MAAQFCKNFNVDDILRDEDEFDLTKQKELEAEHPLQKLTLQQVDKACVLLAEKCVSTDARHFFQSGSRPAILETTTFMFNCLGKRTKFPTTAREKAWSAFHVAYQQNMLSIKAVTGSAQASMWLCFHLFELLLDVNYPITPQAQENEAQEEEESLSENVKDVVCYIGGSVVQKLKQRCLRLKSSEEKEEKLKCLKHFVQNDEDEASVLTTALNRGGLVFLQQNSKDFFCLLERKARSVFQTNTQQEFSAMCGQSQEVFTLFQDMTSECEVSEEMKELIFVQMAQLFFKIRVHHECRKFLDQHKYDTCIPAKGLRKGLKVK
ncbi:uncharacterized protein [Littorina saxatilis]|uniref:uncharacterized protein n=1 Tax=Littorina saxatilis TaxID=31220 RepID=UPI0038B60173